MAWRFDAVDRASHELIVKSEVARTTGLTIDYYIINSQYGDPIEYINSFGGIKISKSICRDEGVVDSVRWAINIIEQLKEETSRLNTTVSYFTQVHCVLKRLMEDLEFNKITSSSIQPITTIKNINTIKEGSNYLFEGSIQVLIKTFDYRYLIPVSILVNEDKVTCGKDLIRLSYEGIKDYLTMKVLNKYIPTKEPIDYIEFCYDWP